MSAMLKEKTVFVFPGQGTQYIGMGADLCRDFPAARYTFEQVSDFSNRDIAKICHDGPADVLNSPENTSLGLFAHSVAVSNIISAEFGLPLYKIAYAIAGHSAGQYSALHCAGSLSMQDAIALLSARALYMSEIKGGMGCIVGLDYETVGSIVRNVGGCGYVAISNHNAYDQIIISGEDAALESALVSARMMGARIAKRLNVGIPAHCGLMENAAQRLRVYLQDIQIRAPQTNWFSNQTANIMSNPMDVRDALADQMTNGVRWYEIMQKFPEYRISRAYELGPGQTLTKLINRENNGCKAAACFNTSTVRSMLDNIADMMVRADR